MANFNHHTNTPLQNPDSGPGPSLQYGSLGPGGRDSVVYQEIEEREGIYHLLEEMGEVEEERDGEGLAYEVPLQSVTTRRQAENFTTAGMNTVYSTLHYN